MNSGKGKKTAIDASRQKELDEILPFYALIPPKNELKEHFEQEVNEFVNGIALMAIKAMMNARIRKQMQGAYQLEGRLIFAPTRAESPGLCEARRSEKRSTARPP